MWDTEVTASLDAGGWVLLSHSHSHSFYLFTIPFFAFFSSGQIDTSIIQFKKNPSVYMHHLTTTIISCPLPSRRFQELKSCF